MGFPLVSILPNNKRICPLAANLHFHQSLFFQTSLKTYHHPPQGMVIVIKTGSACFFTELSQIDDVLIDQKAMEIEELNEGIILVASGSIKYGKLRCKEGNQHFEASL